MFSSLLLSCVLFSFSSCLVFSFVLSSFSVSLCLCLRVLMCVMLCVGVHVVSVVCLCAVWRVGCGTLKPPVCTFKPKHNERLARHYRHEPPPEFSLTLPFSGCVHHLSSPNTLSLSTFKIAGGCRCSCPNIHFHRACSTHTPQTETQADRH